MGVMKSIYTEAQDAFDRYSRDTFGFEPSPLTHEHREMFVTGYVQAVLDEVTKRNQQEKSNER